MDALRPAHPRLSSDARAPQPRPWRALIAGAALGLAATAPAHACRCAGDPADATAYRQAWAVVAGTVQQVQGDPFGPGGATATVHPTHAWKRDLPAPLSVRTSSTCAYDLRAGEPVLLYLRHDGTDARHGFSVRQCMGNRTGDAAASARERLLRSPSATPARLMP